MSDDVLFDWDIPVATPEPGLSPEARRTIRQARAIASGRHPLGLPLGMPLRLHPQAAPGDDRSAPGRRCGNCFHRRTLAWRSRSYPKCCFPEGEGPEDLELLGPPRASHGAGTDCRSWWPGCVDHVYGEPSLSPDAARWVPEATA